MTSHSQETQRAIYLGGFAGSLPSVPIDARALEQHAQRILSPKAFAYVAGGAGSESTMFANCEGFEKLKIVPRMLRDVGVRDTSVQLFGRTLESPFLLSPIGVLELAHRDADLAVARAAATTSVPYVFSCQASHSMEACSAEMGNSPRWFQLYWSKSRDLVSSFVSRAEKCGCEAIVITLDTTMLGWRARDLQLGYLPFLEGKGIAQYTTDPVFQKMMDEPGDAPPRQVTFHSLAGLVKLVNRYPGGNFFAKLSSGRPLRAVRKFIETYSNPSTTWDDLAFVRKQTKLPLLLKGIVHPDDARMAVQAGMDGIIVSNHGGRQVDGAISTIGALPAIIATVGREFPVLLDSGIRSGADAFKAIALGARAVCIGRPYVYGLAIAGERGVAEIIRNYKADFELTMGLAGCKNIAEITPDALRIDS